MIERPVQMLNVEDISFDRENPRIKNALRKYGDKLDAERIHFALRSASEEESGAASFNALKGSMLASGRAMTPITVASKNGAYVCIDGNTRLAIYKQLVKEDAKGDWSQIKAVVLEGAEKRDIESVRVCAHLVGAREWPAYEKASYLHYLRNEKLMDYSEMIALCGGNKVEIERQIDAYHDMNEYYRDVVDDTSFKIGRFSGFVELQKPRIKQAIYDAGLGLKDFGEWIRDGNIYRLADVRSLPKVLGDNEARQVFLEGGIRSIEDAIALIDRRTAKEDDNVALGAASLTQLMAELAQRIDNMPYKDVQAMRDKKQSESAEQVDLMESLSERLSKVLEDVSE